MNQTPAALFQGLPGADLIVTGLSDYHGRRHSIPACLVRMARPRLIKAGVMPPVPPTDDGAELDLYQLVSSLEGSHSYSRYNALVRELVSFEHALDHRMSRPAKDGVRSQESGVRSQESGVRSQESGVRSQESGVRSQELRGWRYSSPRVTLQFTSGNTAIQLAFRSNTTRVTP